MSDKGENKGSCLGKTRKTLNPYPIHSPSWWEWERQVGRA